MNVTESLIEWLKSFEIHGSINSAEDLGDGIILANILSQIAPEFFTSEWLSKIDTDVGTDWRIGASNLRKVYEKIVDYYGEVDIELTENLLPNVTKIAKFYDNEELGLLLQLFLGIAINCHNKSYFVDVINGLNLDVQQGLMNAVQNLRLNDMRKTNESVHNCSTISDHEATAIRQLEKALENVTEQNNQLKEELVQKSNQYKVIVERAEKKSLEDKKIIANLKQNIDLMREELLTIEQTKHEIGSRCDLLEKEVKQLRKENSDFKYSQEKSDEKDVIRYLEEEVSRLKQVNALQLSRIEQIKNENTSRKQSIQSENSGQNEDNSLAELKSEIAKLNKQLQQSRLKLGEQIFRADKSEDNYRIINEKFDELIVENNRNREELKELKQELNRLRRTDSESSDFGNPFIYQPFDYPVNSDGNIEQGNNELGFKESNALLKEKEKQMESDSNYMTCNDINTLKQMLQQKDKEIDNLKEEKSKSDSFRETEEKLMTLSYHKMSLLLQRKSSEDRLKKSVSLLSRQRLSKRTCNSTINFGSNKQQSLIETQF